MLTKEDLLQLQRLLVRSMALGYASTIDEASQAVRLNESLQQALREMASGQLSLELPKVA